MFHGLCLLPLRYPCSRHVSIFGTIIVPWTAHGSGQSNFVPMSVQRGLLFLHGTASLCVTLPFLVLLNLLLNLLSNPSRIPRCCSLGSLCFAMPQFFPQQMSKKVNLQVFPFSERTMWDMTFAVKSTSLYLQLKPFGPVACTLWFAIRICSLIEFANISFFSKDAASEGPESCNFEYYLWADGYSGRHSSDLLQKTQKKVITTQWLRYHCCTGMVFLERWLTIMRRASLINSGLYYQLDYNCVYR